MITVPYTTELTYTLTTRIVNDPPRAPEPGLYVEAVYGLNGSEVRWELIGPIETSEGAVRIANSIKEYHAATLDYVAASVHRQFRERT